MTAYAPTGVPLHPRKQATNETIVLANVEFGVLHSDGSCVNIGICRINTTHFSDMAPARQLKRRCPQAEALMSVSPEGRLRCFFPRSGMLPCTERAFFRGHVFPVPHAYCLPPDLLQNLPGLQQSIIPAGLYPIRQNDEGYWVEF